MVKQGRVTDIKRVVVRSLRLNAIILALDIVALVAYSLLQGVAVPDLRGRLELILLVEAGVLMLAGGGYVLTSGIYLGKVREQVFHSREWSPEECRRSERAALPWILAGVLLLAESLALALV